MAATSSGGIRVVYVPGEKIHPSGRRAFRAALLGQKISPAGELQEPHRCGMDANIQYARKPFHSMHFAAFSAAFILVAYFLLRIHGLSM